MEAWWCLREISSVVGVWIFSGTTQCNLFLRKKENQTGYKSCLKLLTNIVTGQSCHQLRKLNSEHIVQTCRNTCITKGGFPLSRNFYVHTDVNLNWLYVHK